MTDERSVEDDAVSWLVLSGCFGKRTVGAGTFWAAVAGGGPWGLAGGGGSGGRVASTSRNPCSADGG